MSSITIRCLDPELKERLRIRAARHGLSMGAEARRILAVTLANQEPPPETDLYERIHTRFAIIGGVDLDLPTRDVGRELPAFD